MSASVDSQAYPYWVAEDQIACNALSAERGSRRHLGLLLMATSATVSASVMWWAASTAIRMLQS